MKTSIIVGTEANIEGVVSKSTSTLQDIRKQIKDRNYTEVRTTYRAGQHIVEFITKEVSREDLIKSGLIKATKKDKVDK